jgi:hypothetical protein
VTVLQAAAVVRAAPGAVWDVLVDWAGQSRWIPLTKVEAVGDRDRGPGVRVVALSGFRLGRIPVGLLDRFVVTRWTPPATGDRAELEVQHLGPYFTGVGIFHLQPVAEGTAVRCTEIFEVPGGRLVAMAIRVLLPIMRRALQHSLRRLAAIVEGTR